MKNITDEYTEFTKNHKLLEKSLQNLVIKLEGKAHGSLFHELFELAQIKSNVDKVVNLTREDTK